MFSIALTITAAAFLALLYADGSLHRLQQFTSPELQPPALAVPEIQETTSTALTTPHKTRSNRILECTKASGELFYTNAASCDEADLNKTVSYIATAARFSQRNASSTGKSNRSSSSGRSDSVSAQATKQNVPSSMTVGCKWVIGRAQEVERTLSLKNPPKESLWKPNYCRWVCEAWVKQCGNPNDYLDLAGICPRPPPNISDRECTSFAARQVN